MMITKQVNKDHANVQNVEKQYNSFYSAMGTAFVSIVDCSVARQYESIKDSLYYHQGYLDQIIVTLETEHSIIIQGQQGSGKSILSVKIADQMKKQGLITSAYYLNPPSEWNMIKQWIQSIRFQKQDGNCLWIIDNLHKIPNAIEDFPDLSVWGADYCICCTRDMNRISFFNDLYFEMTLSSHQIIKRKIDEKLFLKCYNTIASEKIGRHESDYLYQYVGGNLALLRYIIKNGNLPNNLTDWQNGQFIDFHNIYLNYFGVGNARKITPENLDEILRMLFLSQIDFSIPLHLQCKVCQSVLKDFYAESANKELEIEHASLAELLMVSVCKEYQLNYEKAFTDCLKWVLSNLIDERFERQEQIRQINRFLQLLYGYQWILTPNQILHQLLSFDKYLTDFLQIYRHLISLSTWKQITNIIEQDSYVKEIFCEVATSPQLIDTMRLNCDYDFQFFKDQLFQEEQDRVEQQILSHKEELLGAIVNGGNEINLMQLLLSLSTEATTKLIEQISLGDLVKLLSNTNNGLFLFARYYSFLEDDVKDILGAKLSEDDYRQIFINSASINGFAYLLSTAMDSLQEKMLNLASKDLIGQLIQNTIDKKYSIGALSMSLRGLKKKSVEVLEAFENAIGVDGYEKLLKVQGTVVILTQLIQYSSAEMQKQMTDLLQADPELVKILIDRTISEGSSIGTLNLSIRALKKDSTEALEAFEKAIGVTGYETLLRSQGTIAILTRLIQYSSAEMQKQMSDLLQAEPELVKILIDRTISEGSSIGTLDLSIRALKKDSTEALEAFEKAIGVTGYETLLRSQGTIAILARLIQYSSAEMQKQMSDLLQAEPELVKILVDRTISGGSSIGTLDLSIRALKKDSTEALEAFEKAIGVTGYETLLRSQGTIAILARLIRYSSAEMQKQMSDLLQADPELVKILIDRTISEGSSIGTLDLNLRDLKKDSVEALEAFEKAIGVTGYETLLRSQGTVAILLRLIQYSSAEMQKQMSDLLQAEPELVKILVDRTISGGSSIGTLNLSIRALKKDSVEALEAFEKTIGVTGYEKLLRSQGTVAILARLIQYSSAEMQKQMFRLLQSKPEIVKVLLDQSLTKGCSIATLNIPIRALSIVNYSDLHRLEKLIGVDRYLALFSKCSANTITIMRIMACSTLSDSLVDAISADKDIWNESRDYISEESCTIMKEFQNDLHYAQYNKREKFFRFIKYSVFSEEWLSWIRQGATLEEAILIMRYLPISVASQIADLWLQNYEEVMEDILNVEQIRTDKRNIDSRTVYWGIRGIRNYNEQLFALISNEYQQT